MKGESKVMKKNKKQEGEKNEKERAYDLSERSCVSCLRIKKKQHIVKDETRERGAG